MQETLYERAQRLGESISDYCQLINERVLDLMDITYDYEIEIENLHEEIEELKHNA